MEKNRYFIHLHIRILVNCGELFFENISSNEARATKSSESAELNLQNFREKPIEKVPL